MGEQTGIAWTDHTFNPWWGCVKVSPGCRFCYADSLSSRYGHDVWGKKKPRRIFPDREDGRNPHWADPMKWNHAAQSGVPGVRGVGNHLVFCASMADVFEDHPGLAPQRERLWALIQETPFLDWQLLTKRPENIARFLPPEWLDHPQDNVWLGTSVEDQRRADERIPVLLSVPAAVRFLSVEPLLGPVSFRWASWVPLINGWHLDGLNRIHWVIVGGESGPRHRPMDLDWARSIRDECAQARIPFFFKQVGGRTAKSGGHELDGQVIQQFPGGNERKDHA